MVEKSDSEIENESTKQTKPETSQNSTTQKEPTDPVKLAEQAETFKNEGNVCYKEGKYKEAVDLYTQAIDLVPKNAAYYGNRAAAYFMLKKYKEVVNDSKVALSIDPKYVKGYLREGKAHLFLGDSQSAINCLQIAKSLEPSNASITEDLHNCEAVKQFSEQAQNAFSSGDFRKVIYLMDRCLNHAHDCSKFLLLKAECLCLLGRYQESQEIANEIVMKDQMNPDALYVRGMCLYYQDNSEKAFQHFQRVLQYAPEHDKARVFYKKAKQLQSKKDLGNQAFKAGKWQEAYDLYSECLTLDANNKSLNSILYYNRATTSSKMNNLDKCIEDCTKAIELDDGYVKAYLRRAKCYMDKEEYESAVSDYEKVNKLDKTKENQMLLKDAKLELKKSKRKDYYKILGVSKTASDDEIKKAYRKSALMHHPDRFPNETDEVKKEEERKFKEVGEAYAVLSDPNKKMRYDNGQDLDDSGSGMSADIDPNLLFQAFFGGGGGFGGGGSGGRSRGGGFPGGFQFSFG
ncbi:unnamed protein product [Brachionus calyciflorus]|uniref:DnaJ homolog subfamily C member 7 n=1 Tax=Brachionus calyciflorus TaxID=104777 RepID=A0A813N849_9BILA|nr:unnamed protein product [Brachionus calyciflorus]